MNLCIFNYYKDNNFSSRKRNSFCQMIYSYHYYSQKYIPSVSHKRQLSNLGLFNFSVSWMLKGGNHQISLNNTEIYDKYCNIWLNINDILRLIHYFLYKIWLKSHETFFALYDLKIVVSCCGSTCLLWVADGIYPYFIFNNILVFILP